MSSAARDHDLGTFLDAATNRSRRHTPARRFPRLRADLEHARQWVQTEPRWHLKDPLTLEYFTFSLQEYAILQQLDGSRSLDDIQAAFDRQFAPQKLKPSQLEDFLMRLASSGLLHGSRAPAARRAAWQRFHPGNLLAIRLPGFDIDPALNWLHARVRGLWGWPTLVLCIAVMLVALGVLLTQPERFASRLPTLEAFMSVQNLLWLGVALSLSRLLHELGHALACKHFGGECHDAGILFLVFTPCLYCDVSDSWMAASRWQRIAISAAGIFVDLLIASVALIAWSFSKPGFAGSLLQNLVLICGISTLLVNGNPLLRYDGYYILSDLLDVPNLWGRSRNAMQRFLGRWFLGSTQQSQDAPAGVLVGYGLASASYRVLVLGAILLLLYRWLSPLGLRLVADVLLASIVSTTGLAMVVGTSRVLAAPPEPAPDAAGGPPARAYRLPHLLITATLIVGLGYVLLRVPTTGTLRAPFVVQFAEAVPVYVPDDGQLKECLPAGTPVLEGTRLATLASPSLARETIRLEGLIDRQRQRLAGIEAVQFEEPEVATQLPAAKQLLADLLEQLREKRKQQSALSIHAPRAGVVLRAPPRPRPDVLEELPSWHGSPTDPHNQDSFLSRGTLLCLVGNPDAHEALAIVDDAQVGRLEVGAPVTLAPLGARNLLRGRIAQIAQHDLQVLPDELVVDREVAARQDAFGNARPLDANFQLRIELVRREAQESLGVHGLRGTARIAAESEPVLMHVRRWLHRNFF